MSRDQVDAEIVLDEGEFEPGASLVLRFRLHARSAVKIRGAHVRFDGFEETKAVYTTSDGKTTTTHTATERNVLVEAARTFQGRAPAGFFANVADAALTMIGAGDHERLEQGSHDVELRVDLPAELPPTFKAEKARIAYEATVHLDIPAGRDFRKAKTFELPAPRLDYPPAREKLVIRYPEDSGRGFFDSMFGPDVAMRVELDSPVVARGDVVSGQVEVRFPDKPPRVSAVVTKLLRRENSEARSHKDSHVKQLGEQIQPQREGTGFALFVPFAVRVPDDAIPSHAGAKYTIRHEVAVSLDVPWAKDPTIRVPVTIV